VSVLALLSPPGDGISLGTVLALGGLSALLTLDDTSFAQTWFSQPLPAGILAGFVVGEPLAGVAVGLPFQLVALGNLPVGQTFTGEKVSATVAGVGGAVLAGYRPVVPTGLPGPDGAQGELGWLLLGVGLFSLAGNWVVRAERRAHFLWMLEGHRGLRDGRLIRFDLIQGRCLAATALRGLGLGLLWLMVTVFLWVPLGDRLPDRVLAALAWLPLLSVPIALGILVDRYGLRACWRCLSLGALASLLVFLVLG
jgi:hypothetical protein